MEIWIYLLTRWEITTIQKNSVIIKSIPVKSKSNKSVYKITTRGTTIYPSRISQRVYPKHYFGSIKFFGEI
ncbi:hypothetical protein [Fusobacterium vincentii ATCC 49256]|uniref:Uncharacterized protein n=1 Tax=Fusobacterium vincentii ATCC 49256 TaxID=209882 RepID=Q7P3L7_FUSVC|nr:hypothetical protein [Fusobacterium vincentii ATCC 49256]